MPKLLLVDDESDVREFAASFFRKRDIEVVTAGNGKDALDILQQQKIDLVLLDIKIPGLDGVEVLKIIKETSPQVKVIMVSGKDPGEEEVSSFCRSLGALNYIHKPLELDELEDIVMKAFRKSPRD